MTSAHTINLHREDIKYPNGRKKCYENCTNKPRFKNIKTGQYLCNPHQYTNKAENLAQLIEVRII